MIYKGKELEKRGDTWYIKGSDIVVKTDKPLVTAFREAVDEYNKPKKTREKKTEEPEKVVFKGGITPMAEYGFTPNKEE